MASKQPKLSLKNRALRFLALREYSRLELGRKLVRYAEEGDDIEALLDFLEDKRFLSTERFSEALIRRRAGQYGNQRILAELQTHGLDANLIEQSKSELAQTEIVRARAVWQKKFGRAVAPSAVPENDQSQLREQRAKQVRYLMQRGFSSGAIKAALDGNVDEAETFF